MKRKSRRISIGFGYIGFGNKQSNFNQKNDNPFTTNKERLQRESQSNFQLDFLNKKLSKADKELIKNKIRKSEKRRYLIAICLTVILIVLIIYLAKEYVLPSFKNDTNF